MDIKLPFDSQHQLSFVMRNGCNIVVNFSIHYNVWVCLCKATSPGLQL